MTRLGSCRRTVRGASDQRWRPSVRPPRRCRRTRALRRPARASRSATAGSRSCSRRPGSGSARPSPRPSRQPAVAEVVERKPEAVGAQEPGERLRACGAGSDDRRSPGRRRGTPARTPRRRSACSSASALRAAAAVPAGVADQHQAVVLRSRSPRGTRAPRARPRRLARSPVIAYGAKQRQRQQRVVVGERRLEPAPVGGRAASR